MPSLHLQRTDVVVRVDTHKDQHLDVALDGIGGRLGSHALPATAQGYADLLSWTREHGRAVVFGVEGTGSVEVLRIAKVARGTAVKARTQAMIKLKSVLVTSPDELRAELRGRSDSRLITACAELPDGPQSDPLPSTPSSASRYALGSLAERWLALHGEIKEHTRHLERITSLVAPQLTAAFGIGFDSAAELLITAGDNGERIWSGAAFAKLCGVCPIPASSGRTTGRHRLNRGANWQANAVLYRIVVVRMRWYEPTMAYVARRTAEGRTKKEVIRCLKRYVAREVFHLLPRSAEASTKNL